MKRKRTNFNLINIDDNQWSLTLEEWEQDARALVKQKCIGQPISIETWLDQDWLYYCLRSETQFEKNAPRLNVMAANRDEFALWTCKQAKEHVWKNAATVYMCLERQGMGLPAELWRIIVGMAMHAKDMEMSAFFKRITRRYHLQHMASISRQ